MIHYRKRLAPESLETEYEKLLEEYCQLDPCGEWNDKKWNEFFNANASSLLKEFVEYASRKGDEGELRDVKGEFLLDKHGHTIQRWSIGSNKQIVDEGGNMLFYSDGAPVMAKKLSDMLFTLLQTEWDIADEERWY